MKTRMEVLSTIIIVVGAVYFQSIAADANSTTPDNYEDEMDTEDAYMYSTSTMMPMTIAWIEKPPYTTSPSNDSLQNDADEPHGLIRDALLQYLVDCSEDDMFFELLQVDSEFGMVDLLKHNKVQVALPIFEPSNNRRYSKFHFVKIHNYPGIDFISTEDKTNGIDVILESVKKSWPLLAVTLILTAIAGIIIWGLDTYWNPEEFPRSFFKGSLDGFWWSFISMTTVGYGDKAPKSIAARIFSIVWILLGLVTMAIFTANVTSALTAISLEQEPSSLAGMKVAVLSNGTEYQYALEEGANPKVYNTIDDIIQAVKSKQVNGMLLDRYTASYYQSRGKLKSLIIKHKLEIQSDVGILIAEDEKDFAGCLDYYRSDIWRSVQTITDTYKLTQLEPTKKFSLFDDSSSFIERLLYTSLGVLLGLIVIGTAWDIIILKRIKRKQRVIITVAVNDAMTTERVAIRTDLEVARTLLLQMQEHFNKLETRVLQFQNNH